MVMMGHSIYCSYWYYHPTNYYPQLYLSMSVFTRKVQYKQGQYATKKTTSSNWNGYNQIQNEFLRFNICASHFSSLPNNIQCQHHYHDCLNSIPFSQETKQKQKKLNSWFQSFALWLAVFELQAILRKVHRMKPK